jgi:hypothetical protein
VLSWGNSGALGGTRTPNLLIRSQMLYPLSYERSHCSILHPERSPGVLTAHARAHGGDRASDFLILNELNLMIMNVFGAHLPPGGRYPARRAAIDSTRPSRSS